MTKDFLWKLMFNIQKKFHKIHNDLLKSYIDLHKDLRKKVKN